MKVLITVLFLMALLPHAWGQQVCALQYTYNDAGERVRRQIVTCFRGGDEDVAALRAVVKDNKPLQKWQLAKSSLKAYPNPSNGVFDVVIDNPQANTVLDLYDFAGRKMTSQSVTTGTIPINANSLVTGSYMVIYRDAEKVLGQLKVIIE